MSAFAAVAAVVIVVAVHGGHQDAAAAQFTPPVVAGSADFAPDPPSEDSGTSDSAVASTDPISSTDPASTALTPGAVPTGYVRTTGPEGVEVSIPATWPVTDDGTKAAVFQADDPDGSGSFVRFGGSPSPSMSLRDSVVQLEKETLSSLDSYQQVQLDEVDAQSGDETVVWEFTFVRDGVQRHAIDYFWRTGGSDFAVYGSAAETNWPDMQQIIEVLEGTAGPV